MNIDVRDTEIIIDSKVLAFPASFSDLQDILGEARIVPKNDRANYYIFDKLGITFCDVDERYLKRRKAFIDKEHLISYVTFFIDDTELMNEAEIPAERFNGNITFFGREWDSLKKSDGSSQYFSAKTANIDLLILRLSYVEMMMNPITQTVVLQKHCISHLHQKGQNRLKTTIYLPHKRTV